MAISRRQFLKGALITGVGLALPTLPFKGNMRRAYAFSQSPLLTKFTQPLPGLGPTGIPVAVPNTSLFPGADFYQLEVAQFTQQVHPDLPATRFWGYADITGGKAANHRYLGGAVVAQKGRPVRFDVKNSLPTDHILPVDDTIMAGPGGLMVGDLPKNRICVHLHGGLVPWISDGGPFAWFDPNGMYGPSAKDGSQFFGVPDMGTPVNGHFTYFYPNDQSARLVWYHDHSIGITRLNAYAGIASGYIIRDNFEQALVNNHIIPDFGHEIPLIIQDKTFFTGNDPKYPVTGAKPGDLWYPYLYEPDRWTEGADGDPTANIPPGTVPPVPSCVPEFFADTTLVNGAAYPFAEVQPRHYRFRILNGSQARFHNLQLYYAKSKSLSDPNSGEANLKKPGPRFVQIGTEGGFLPFPVVLNNPPVPFSAKLNESGDPIPSTMRFNLLLAPAERADLIIDFSSVPVGSALILYSDTPAPFPMGDQLNDYFTGDPDQTGSGGAPSTKAGFGPNTRTLLQFRVVPRVGASDPPSLDFLEHLALKGDPFLTGFSNAFLPAVEKLDTRHSARIRDLTLNEDFDELGRLIQRQGTNVQNGNNNQGLPTWARNYLDAATETPHAGGIEIWRIFNLTGDTHPIHFHLVNVQVLERRPFDVEKYNGTPKFTGPGRRPDLNELGWKETVRMNPGEMTAVIMKFDLPKTPFKVAESPRTGGHEYVWHCHILEHEEHDMMRPLVVKVK